MWLTYFSFVGVGRLELPTYAGYKIYSLAPIQFEHHSQIIVLRYHL